MDDRENRCQGPTSQGQCSRDAVEGSEFCTAHGGSNKRSQSKEIDQYRADRAAYANRLEDLGKMETVHLLRQSFLKSHDLANDLYHKICTQPHSDNLIGPINQLFRSQKDLIKALTEAGKELGSLMEREQYMKIATEIVKVISDELEGKYEGWEDSLEHIGENIAELFKGK